MPGNSFGQIYKITTCGESHGEAIGVIIDGCPSNLSISPEDIQFELDRRKPGQSTITTPRHETDKIHIISGVFNGKTTGSPILLLSYNQDMKPQDYNHIKDIFRPSHADYTYHMKYGNRDYRGGGRSSARETLARVAAGAVAKKFLNSKGIEVLSFVRQVGRIKAKINYKKLTFNTIEQNDIRCPNTKTAIKMIEYITEVKNMGDSVGGIIQCIIRGVPVGLGEPVFDKLHAELGKAMLSINAVKGFEIGSGFNSVNFLGSSHNDELTISNNKVTTKTNNAGGIIGGISNGEDIICNIVFKPTATIKQTQATVNIHNSQVTFNAQGRHDPCVLPRAVPIVDAMAYIVIMDYYLRQKVYNETAACY